eukprot:663333-Amphidinium_carterae.1
MDSGVEFRMQFHTSRGTRSSLATNVWEVFAGPKLLPQLPETTGRHHISIWRQPKWLDKRSRNQHTANSRMDEAEQLATGSSIT